MTCSISAGRNPEGNRTLVLGVDTSLRCSGLALVEVRGSSLRALGYSVVKNPPALHLSRCLANIYAAIEATITGSRPDSVAVEGIFYCRNVRTAVVLGEARGAVIAACAASGVAVYEYPPRRIKQAVVGFGAADKGQVQRMVCAILGLDAKPSEDEADALAVAICHANSMARPELGGAKEI